MWLEDDKISPCGEDAAHFFGFGKAAPELANLRCQQLPSWPCGLFGRAAWFLCLADQVLPPLGFFWEEKKKKKRETRRNRLGRVDPPGFRMCAAILPERKICQPLHPGIEPCLTGEEEHGLHHGCFQPRRLPC